MDKEIPLIDIIKPLWLRRYELIFSIVLFAILVISSLFLVSVKSDYDSKKYYHQDVKFNDQLDQKYVQLLSDTDLLKKSYLENGLDPYNDGIKLNVINHSSRYDAMKENVVEENIELLIKTLGIDLEKKERSLWETYLNLDSDYYQLVFVDENLSVIESNIILTNIIKNYNLMINSNNFLDSNLFPEVAFDQNDENLLYLDNRLQMVNAVIDEFEERFKENNFDAGEVKYKSQVLMAHIFNKDPSPLITNLERLEQDIAQNVSLKNNLEELHSKFYIDSKETSLTNTDTQLTVDSVSQLIDLGKDFSLLNNKMDLIDTIYDIELNISSLKKSIFELNLVQKLYLKNYTPITLAQVRDETAGIIDVLNYNIRLMNEKEYQQAVFTVGDTYIKKNKMLEINLTLVGTFIILFYSILHIIFIYLRNYKIT
jgi:hypothetical protein